MTSKWKLVPVEADEEIRLAAYGSGNIDLSGLGGPADIPGMWKAMLSASPSPLEDEELQRTLRDIASTNNNNCLTGICGDRLTDDCECLKIARAILKELTGGKE